MKEREPVVLIIGGGFAGIECAKALSRTPCKVRLIDKNNYHLFQPLLYQVATAALSPADIAYPIRAVFRDQPNVEVHLGEVTSVSVSEGQVTGTFGVQQFDFLVVASGVTSSYFGNDGWAPFAPGLKTIEDAREIRRRILLAFERAEHEPALERRKSLLTFVVVGGGPTGVELAGALKEIAVEAIPEDFRHIDTKSARVILIEGSDRLLPTMHPKLSAVAKKDLERMGIEVRTSTRVTAIDGGGVLVGTERIEASNVFWGAGVQAPSLLKTMGVEIDRQGRVKVGPDLSVPGYPNIFVVGDSAAITDATTKTPVPGVAQAAMQSGKFVGKLIAAEVRGKRRPTERPSFSYRDKGSMATIGRAKAVAEIAGVKLKGLLAWIIWSFVHVMFLIGYRNRLVVIVSWMWSYVVENRGARIIGDSDDRISPAQTKAA